MEDQNSPEISLEVKGRFLKIVSVRDDWVIPIDDPERVLSEIQRGKIAADIFTFAQSLPETQPKYPYYMEWDNVAMIRISTFTEWYQRKIHPNVRNRIKKAEKEGIEVRIEPFSDNIVQGIVDIFNENPIRQGRRFAYYGKDFESVRREWATDLDRSEFLIAYYGSEIVGFIKLIYGSICVRTSGTIAKISHRDKAPMNALIAAAVARCATKNFSYLLYGKYVYGKKNEGSLEKFKRYNGFEKIDLPRYFIPLSGLGSLALKLKLHHSLKGVLPKGLIEALVRARTKWYERRYSRVE